MREAMTADLLARLEQLLRDYQQAPQGSTFAWPVDDVALIYQEALDALRAAQQERDELVTRGACVEHGSVCRLHYEGLKALNRTTEVSLDFLRTRLAEVEQEMRPFGNNDPMTEGTERYIREWADQLASLRHELKP